VFTATKKQCGTCGARNDLEAERCRVCTRSLSEAVSPSHAAFEEVLYANPVRDSETKRRWVNPWFLVVLAVIGLLAANFQWWGYGPSWASRSGIEHLDRGDSWRVLNELDGYTLSFPANATIDAVDGPTGQVRRAWAGVDDQWSNVTAGATGFANAEEDVKRSARRFTGVVVAASLTAPDRPADDAQAVLDTLLDQATISELNVRPVTQTDYGNQWTIDAKARGGFGRILDGRMRARFIVFGDRMFVVATFSVDRLDVELQNSLINGIRVPDKFEPPSGDR